MNRKRKAFLVSVSLLAFILVNLNILIKDELPHSNKLSRHPSSTEEAQEDSIELPKGSDSNIQNITQLPKKLDRNVQKSIDVYKRMLLYPASTQPLDSRLTVDPIEQKLLPQQKSVLGLRSHTNELLAQITKSYFTLEEKSVPIHIETTTKNSYVNTLLTLVLDNKKSLNISPLQTGIYQFDLPLEGMSEGSHTITVIAKFQDEEVTNLLHFQLNKSLVEFVKANSADIDPEGNLVFSNYFNFLEAGTYLIEGTLYTDENQLIGKSQSILKVDQGIHPVELNFYGYLLFQRKESGNFFLKNIQINQVDERLVTRGNYAKQINQRTPHLTWEQFNSKPYNNDLIQEKLSLLDHK